MLGELDTPVTPEIIPTATLMYSTVLKVSFRKICVIFKVQQKIATHFMVRLFGHQRKKFTYDDRISSQTSDDRYLK